MKDVIDKLRDDEHYYGEFGRQYMSNSNIGTLLNNPSMFGAVTQETVPMVVGRFLHVALLEPEKLGSFNVVDASSRNTNIYKDASPGRISLLSKEAEQLQYMIDKIKGNRVMNKAIYESGNRFEEPAVGELFGLKWKGKADILCKDRIIDIKTTGDIDKFKYSADKYNYDSQAYIYSVLFGVKMDFFVIDKPTLRLGIFESTDEFLLRGREKVQRAVHIYNKFFGDSPTHDINQYIHIDSL